MKYKKTIGFVIVIIMMVIGGFFIAKPKEKDIDLEHQIIPEPLQYETTEGTFTVDENTSIYVQGESEAITEELYRTGEILAMKMRKSTGFPLVVKKEKPTDTNVIYLTTLGGDTTWEEEGYTLEVTTDTITVQAYQPAGVFRGVQTLRQLFPVGLEKDTVQKNVGWSTPCVSIYDKPEYAYRGMMLDVARHFFTVEQVKRQIDHAAQYKINALHLHLADDQGWRLEIQGGRYGEEYSMLTTIGGKTSVDGGDGGYYTQEEFKELVAYAAERYIEIIPEIDMPGHTWAALSSLDFLNSEGTKQEGPYTGTDVGFSSLDCNSEKTYEFIDDVIRQIVEISPSSYIHIGGDEADETSIEDYTMFMNRVTDIVQSYGKTPIGWQYYEKVVEQNHVIGQYWRIEGDTLGGPLGMQHIVSPANRAYLDMKYDRRCPYGLQWAGFISVKRAYTWDPTDYGTKDQIFGIEMPLWTENIVDNTSMDHMLYPRLLGIAEIGWTPKEKRDWETYEKRLQAHGERLENQQIEYYKDDAIW